jgi:hypothetical protein
MKLPMRRVGSFLVGVIGWGISALAPGSAAAIPIAIPQSAFSGTETVIDFNSLAPGTPITTQFLAEGVTFSGGLYAGFPSFGQAQNFEPFTTNTAPITIDFSSAMLRTGFDVVTVNEEDLVVQVSAYSGNLLVQTGEIQFMTGATSTFAGIEDVDGIDRLVLSAVGPSFHGFVIDNFRFEAAAIPEPSAALLFPAGMFLAASCIRRRQRKLA